VVRSVAPKAPVVGDKKKKKRRADAVNAIYEKYWEGKNIVGFGADKEQAWIMKSLDNSIGFAARSFFAWDLTSAAKNYYGALFQVSTEAAISKYPKYINYKNYSLGRIWASRTMAQLSANIYNTGVKPLNVQLGEIMDFSQGRFWDKFGESISRSFARDTAEAGITAGYSVSTSHRQYLQLQLDMQLMAGVMHTVMVEQDGKMIRYIDAWELKDNGVIGLKEGIDKSYDRGGKKFIEIRNAIHELSNLNQGAYAKADSNYADRFVAYKSTIAIRKFFLKMFINRVNFDQAKTIENIERRTGKKVKNPRLAMMNPRNWDLFEETWNPALNDFHIGFWIDALKNSATVMRDFRKGSLDSSHFSKQNMYGLYRIILNNIKIQLWSLLTYALLGWYDPEDDERLAKLRERSGALPYFLVDEDWSKNFNARGWLGQHIGLMMYKVDEENRFFNNPTGILDLWSESTVFGGGSVGLMLDAWRDLNFALKGDSRGYYKKDVGPMLWQQEGSPKFIKHLARMAGKKGQFESPATTFKNYEQIRRQKGTDPTGWYRYLMTWAQEDDE
jgi:hypothetical protein